MDPLVASTSPASSGQSNQAAVDPWRLTKRIITRIAVGALSLVILSLSCLTALGTGVFAFSSPVVAPLLSVTLGAVGCMTGFCFLFYFWLPPWSSSSPNPQNHVSTLKDIFLRISITASSVLSFWIAGLAATGSLAFSAPWVAPVVIIAGVTVGSVALFCAIFWKKLPAWLSTAKPSSGNDSSSSPNPYPSSDIPMSGQTMTDESRDSQEHEASSSTTGPDSTSDDISERATMTNNHVNPLAHTTPISAGAPYQAPTTERTVLAVNSALSTTQPSTTIPSNQTSSERTLQIAATSATNISSSSSANSAPLRANQSAAPRSWPQNLYYEHAPLFGLGLAKRYPAAPNREQSPLNIVHFYYYGDVPIAQDPNRAHFHGLHGVTLNMCLSYNIQKVTGRSPFSVSYRVPGLFSAGEVFYPHPILFPTDAAITGDYGNQLVPILDQPTMTAFRNSVHLKEQVLKVFNKYLYLNHFKLERSPTLRIEPTSEFQGLTQNSGVCRIYHSLYLLGLPDYSDAFFAALKGIYDRERTNQNFIENNTLIPDATYQSLVSLRDRQV